jgi:hypothetical protein
MNNPQRSVEGLVQTEYCIMIRFPGINLSEGGSQHMDKKNYINMQLFTIIFTLG